jgi:membrane fusion protein (multidrug efflux system)
MMLRNSTLFIVSLFLSFACGSKKDDDAKKNEAAGKKAQPQGVIGYVVKEGTITEDLTLPAHLLPEEATEIHPEISGILQSLSIKEGEMVQQGALLAKIGDEELQAQLKKLNVQLQIAIKTEERNTDLLKVNGISQQEYDISFLQVSNIRADIELIKSQIRKTEVRAPFSGKVGFRNVSPGAYVTPATALTTIRQIQTLKLEFSVPDKYAARIKNGEEFYFNVQGSSTNFRAKVYATESFINEQTRGMNIRCRVIDNDPSLVSGAFASIHLNTGNNDQSMLVPTQSIIPQTRGKKVIVYRGGIAQMTDVQTGLRDSARVEILSGLKIGDTILVTGLMSVKQDSPVKLTKVE